MYHLTHGISSLLHSINLILFTLLLVHLILHASPYHSLQSPPLLSPSITPSAFQSRLVSQMGLPSFICTAFTEIEPVPDYVGTGVCFSFFFLFSCFWFHVLD